MVSPRKSTSALGLIPEDGKMNVTATKSCESLYSNSSKGSANIIYSRKQSHGMSNKLGGGGGGGSRQPTIIPATNDVRQRVLSARRLRVKTFQNQLADAQQTIAELAHENRILRTLHKRQDSALSKYESNNAELPQLLHSHAEELRVWQTKYRNLQSVNKELEQKLKQKEAVILSLGDQNKYYIQLNKDKNLEDRQRLTEKLQMLETRLQEKDNDIKMMARKLQLEAKQSKQHLLLEQKKTKEVLMKLENARLELSGFRKLEELQFQEKFNMTIRRNKGGNNDNFKDDRDLDKNPFTTTTTTTTTDAETAEDTEAPNSQRSTHSTHNLTERTSRTIKRVNISHTSTKIVPNLSSSTAVLKQINKQQPPANANKSALGALGRIDQGDGDAAIVQEIYKPTNLNPTKNQQKQHTTLTTILPPQPERIPNVDVYADDYVNVEDDLLEETAESGDELTDNQNEDLDLNGGFMKNIDGAIDNNPDNVVEEDEDDLNQYFDGPQVELSNNGKKTRMKEEISSIRKQISNDYKEREAFLDTFCRQATSGVLKEEPHKKRNSIAVERNVVPSSRKHKLLAALKAIDDNKSQD